MLCILSDLRLKYVFFYIYLDMLGTKWFISPQFEHVFTQDWHLSRSCFCLPPQNLQLYFRAFICVTCDPVEPVGRCQKLS